tara:strand:- start:256 stop:747 length:492 start_codon:yes stop_codon:yes gene_type:complete
MKEIKMPGGVQYGSQQEAQEYADTFDDASGPTAVTMEMSNPDTGEPYWVVINKDPMDLDGYFNWMNNNDTGMMSEQGVNILPGQSEFGAAITEDGATQAVDILPDQPGLGALLPPPPLPERPERPILEREADLLNQYGRKQRGQMRRQSGNNMINALGGYQQP